MDNENAPDCAIRVAKRRPLSQHAAFVPIISIWTAAVLALPLLVMPVVMATGLGASVGLAGQSPAILSGIAAIFGAVLGFGAARSVAAYQSSARAPTLASAHTQNVYEPEQHAETSAGDQAGDDDILVLEEACIEPVELPEDKPVPHPEPAQETPSEMAVAVNFLPWSDAAEQPSAEIISTSVALEASEPIQRPAPQAQSQVQSQAASEPEPEPELPPAPEPQANHVSITPEATVPATPIGGKAVRKLRGADLDDLNMVQLLERFAVALDQHRDAVGVPQGGSSGLTRAEAADQARASHSGPQDPAANRYRDLDIDMPRSGVSTRTRAIATENALRNALLDLDRLSGAA